MKTCRFALTVAAVFAAVSCATVQTLRSEPKAPIKPINIGGGLAGADLCDAIPREDIEAVMGRKLNAAPKRFDYYETAGASGCWYEAAKDSNGEAHFGYVVLTPLADYENQPLHLKVDAGGIGDEAYFNNGADCRQLWVKMRSKNLAFVVGFGDVENEEGAQSLAKLIVPAIQ